MSMLRSLARASLRAGIGLTALALAIEVSANTVTLEWDPVDDPRVGLYEVHWGTQSGVYLSSAQTTATHTTIDQLTAGQTYYFAAKACDKTGTRCSAFSQELSTRVHGSAAVADFSASRTRGTVPLTVTFDASSQHGIDRYAWDFGDGSTSTAGTAVHTFDRVGRYTVSLTVTRPGGSPTETRSALIHVEPEIAIDAIRHSAPKAARDSTAGGDARNPGDLATDAGLAIELGELEVTDAWQRVELERRFADPVVVAKLMSAYDADPAIVRVKEVDASGFSLRVQEWDYLDGAHGPELVSYLVVERGRHQLPNGAWLEAGRVTTSARGAFIETAFAGPFDATPVVFTAVTTHDDAAAVTTRLRHITATGFETRLFAQEASDQGHATERIGYVAVEPSRFMIDGIAFQATRPAEPISDLRTDIDYAVQGAQPPLLFGELQSTNGSDTATLRADQVDHGMATVWVEEEQSLDPETRHTTETAGLLIVH